MIATSKARPSIHYSPQTLLRAERAMRCSPFQLHLFAAMISQSVSLGEIAHDAGVQNQYTFKPLTELRVEGELLWLIQVGLLRREVDGQGLTDSFRVTPLGRQLVDRWHHHRSAAPYSPNWRDRIFNVLTRWFRLPS